MKRIFLFLLALFLAPMAFGQGVAIRANSGLGTNTAFWGSITNSGTWTMGDFRVSIPIAGSWDMSDLSGPTTILAYTRSTDQWTFPENVEIQEQLTVAPGQDPLALHVVDGGSNYLGGINVVSNLTVLELGAAPGAPVSGRGSVYAKSSDGKLYYKDDAGTEYDLTANSGAATAFNDIADASAAGIIAFGAFNQGLTSTLDGGTILGTTNTDADLATDTIVFALAFNDGADANGIFARFVDDADGTPRTVFEVSQTGLTLAVPITTTGNGTFGSGNSGHVDFGATGVRGGGTNGVFTFTGLGDGADEAFALDVNTTANTLGISSTTGGNMWIFTGIDLQVAGRAYNEGTWNGSLRVPTEDAVRDKIESMTGTPGGAGTQVQFNDSGVFGGDPGLTFTKATDILKLGTSDARLDLGDTGVSLLSTNGNLVIKGNGDGADENLEINVNDSANRVLLQSGTGVTNIDTGTIGIDGDGATNFFGALYTADNKRLNQGLAVYAAGTAYAMTASDAAVDFGTTDPALVLDSAGTYLIFGRANLKYNAATYAGSQTATIKLRRTNNTAADLANSSTVASLRIITAITDTVGVMPLAPVLYTTANADDSITLFGQLSAAPSAGSVDVTEASVVAIRLF